MYADFHKLHNFRFFKVAKTVYKKVSTSSSLH